MTPGPRKRGGRRLRPAPPLPRAPRARRPDPYSRTNVLARWGGCAYCDGPAEELDHVHAIALGGPDRESNVVGVCRQCNAAKAGLSLAAWATAPVTPPTENECAGRSGTRGDTRE